jgi:hypothetical protein
MVLCTAVRLQHYCKLQLIADITAAPFALFLLLRLPPRHSLVYSCSEGRNTALIALPCGAGTLASTASTPACSVHC